MFYDISFKTTMSVESAIEKYYAKYQQEKAANADKIDKAKQSLIKALANEQLSVDPARYAARQGKKCEIIITSDPGEEFDDLAMIKFVVLNLDANVIVIISGGAMTPRNRFILLQESVPELRNNSFMVPFFNRAGGYVMFMEDNGSEFANGLLPVNCDMFINCGPTTSHVLRAIACNIRPGGRIITVGANDDGTAAAGINQKITDEPGKPAQGGMIKDAEGNMVQSPQMIIWNNFIETVRNKSVNIENLPVEVSRYVLFPNPRKAANLPEYSKLADDKHFYEKAVTSTAMFIASRPPPMPFAMRVNEGNSIFILELLGKDKIIPETTNMYFHASNVINNYRSNAKCNDIVSVDDIVDGAVIPFMATASLGGIRVKKGDNYFFGSGPQDRQDIEQSRWVEDPIAFRNAIKELNYFTPAYDVIAVLKAIHGGF